MCDRTGPEGHQLASPENCMWCSSDMHFPGSNWRKNWGKSNSFRQYQLCRKIVACISTSPWNISSKPRYIPLKCVIFDPINLRVFQPGPRTKTNPHVRWVRLVVVYVPAIIPIEWLAAINPWLLKSLRSSISFCCEPLPFFDTITVATYKGWCCIMIFKYTYTSISSAWRVHTSIYIQYIYIYIIVLYVNCKHIHIIITHPP